MLAITSAGISSTEAQKVGQFRYFNDLTAFNQAAGDPPAAINFDGIPAGTEISSTTIAGVSFDFGTAFDPALLMVVGGAATYTPTGCSGGISGLTSKLFPTSGANVLSPEGEALEPGPANPSVEKDDIVMTFDPPVCTVGLDVLFQELDCWSGVTSMVLNPNGDGGGAPGGSGFVGFVALSPEIASIIIDDFDSDVTFPDANIGLDTVRIALTCLFCTE